MNKLAKYLKQKGLIQNRFAEKVGTTPGNLSRLIQGRGSISLRLAYAIELETDGRITVYDWIPIKSKNVNPSLSDVFDFMD